MTEQKLLRLKSKLETALKISIFYGEAQIYAELPYGVIRLVGSDDILADDTIYIERSLFDIELYTERKNFKLEKQLKHMLLENEIIYTSSGDIRIEDGLHLTTFEIEM